jgi:hypothetical protein
LERRLSHDLPPATRRKRISPTTRYENNEKLIQAFYKYESLMALKEIRIRKPERTPVLLRKPLVLSEAKENDRLILEEELADSASNLLQAKPKEEEQLMEQVL